MNTHPLELFHTDTTVELPVQELSRITRLVFRGESLSVARVVNLITCSDYKIRKLNRMFRNRDKVTDVLSFPFEDDDFLGEIYISLKRVAVQSRRFGLTFKEEFLRLSVHGLLHLAGYDHIEEGDRDVMERIEKKYLKKVFITI